MKKTMIIRQTRPDIKVLDYHIRESNKMVNQMWRIKQDVKQGKLSGDELNKRLEKHYNRANWTAEELARTVAMLKAWETMRKKATPVLEFER